MEFVINLLLQRRVWAFAIPIIITAAKAAGIEITEDILTNTKDQVVAAVMALLSLWSYVRPKK